MSSPRLEKLIVRIVDKKSGIKLGDLFKYLEAKAKELDLEITLTDCKAAATALFSAKKIDLIEYKLPGDGEKNKMFLLPIGCTVVHGGEDDSSTSEAEDEVFAQLAETEQAPVLLLPEMFQSYHVVGKDSFVSTEVPEHAKALYLKALGDNEEPRMFGAVPISIECEISYKPPTAPLVSTVVPEEGPTEGSDADSGTPTGTDSLTQ
jgi:hypothetical protein